MHLFSRPDQVNQPLYVVCTIFNPIRYRTRWKLYCDFVRMCEAAGAVLYTAEIAFGDREFAVTQPDNPRHLQLRSSEELWLKENSLNLMIQRLPLDWQYVAWVDADVTFARSDWANETIQQLQHYAAVQMWSEAVDLSPKHEIVARFRSFMWCYYNDTDANDSGDHYTCPGPGVHHYWHPGFAWAFRRETIDQLGGIVDWTILGGGDTFTARAMLGRIHHMPKSLGASGQQWLQIYQERALRNLHMNVGYVDGAVSHYWHGSKADRRYEDRGTILTNGHFDPVVDLYRDWQGLWQLRPENITLREGIRRYFRVRNEDSI